MEPNRSYTPESRAEAVKRVLEQGLSLAEAAERLLIPKGTLTTWVSKAKGGKAPAAPGARSVAEHFGVSYSLSGLYEVLHRAGLSWVSARSKHPQRDAQAQEAFKKTSPSG